MLTTDYVLGVPNWLDLGSPDVEGSAAFYTGVFGWTFTSAGPDAGGYGFFSVDGKVVAAMGPLQDEGATPAWTVYFATPDADATTKAVEQAGGVVRTPAFDVFTHGRMANLTDNQGVEFAVWQGGDRPGLDLVTAPGSLAWVELHVPDVATAGAFYESVFNWNVQQFPMPGFTYTVVAAPDGDPQGFGGIMPNPDAPRPHWLPYIEVVDCDATVAKATERGAQILMAPETVDQVGRMSVLTDPVGAFLAVITSATPTPTP
ncbi:VOC family protein [Streptosporangiaceae bacterium NEAU-GS5]|nr:VOC family protein [Streptosporangiaceae bacterium NEAU-GS5]